MGFAFLLRSMSAALTLALLCVSPSLAQNDGVTELGTPLIEYMNTGTISGLQPQNKTAGMDRRGIMYFGNQVGLVEYDGVSWRRIATPNGVPVFSIDRGADGVLYLGGFRFFGRLVVDSTDRSTIDVLSDSLPEADNDFSFVYETHVIGRTVWFRTEEGLFAWDGRRCRAIRDTMPLGKSFVVNDRLYVLMIGKGLGVLENDRIRLLPGGTLFGDEREGLVFARPLDARRIMIASRLAGVHVFDGRTWMPAWDFPAKLPAGVDIGGGINLADGSIALWTGKSGVWILDAQGTPRLVIDKEVGLGDDSPGALFADDAQNLWVPLDQGLAKIEWPSPMTRFVAENGLSGQVTDVLRYNGTLFVTTTYGLYRLIPGNVGGGDVRALRARFEEIKGTDMECFDLCATRHGLLVADPNAGLLQLSQTNTLSVVSAEAAEKVVCIDEAGDSVLVACPRALYVFAHRQGRWVQSRRFPLEQVTKFSGMLRTDDGRIWASTAQGVVYAVDIATAAPGSGVTRYDSRDGLPRLQLLLGDLHGKLRVLSDSGLYRFDGNARRFLLDEDFAEMFIGEKASTPIMLCTDRFGRLWVQDAVLTYCATPRANGMYERSSAPFGHLHSAYMSALYVDDDGVAWIGADNVLYRYDPAVRKSYRLPFRTLIRRVSTADRVWYNGNLHTANAPAPALPFGHAPITFSFAAAYYGVPDGTYYYYRVPERDTTWIGPSDNTELVFRNFPEGDYRFEVFAVNPEGAVSDIATYHFSVLPPWYRTWWAYLLYLLAAGILILTGRLWYRTRYLRRRGRELEQTVHERTAEIEHKSREIHRQAEELERLDSIVRAVNRESKLPNVLDTLLMQSLQFFPNADTALFVRRDPERNLFRVVTVTGRFAEDLQDREFALRELLGNVDVSMERMREGVYVLSGLGERIAERTGDDSAAETRFMAMSVQRGRVIEGFLVLGSGDRESFGPADLQRLLRLKEHASSAVAKAGAIADLEKKNAELDSTNHQLLATQEQLVVQKKISALGELTAGIAHEIQNPLNFVNNFSELSCELLDELQQGLDALEGPQSDTLRRTVELVKANCEHIRQHGRRATSIVSAMIMHSRNGTSTRDNVPLNDLVDEFVMLAYHGVRLQFPQFQLDLQRKYDENVGKVTVLPQDLSRAIVNICNNAWEAAILKAAQDGPGAVPTVLVRSLRVDDSVHVLIRDNGAGIEDALAERIFEPFFTTKRDSRNAGLGLSMSHEIITQLHRGELKVRSEAGKFTEFEIRLPAGGD
jgi:signal transduction histidine kinase/ligand-binding sensor domain-containing protein